MRLKFTQCRELGQVLPHTNIWIEPNHHSVKIAKEMQIKWWWWARNSSTTVISVVGRLKQENLKCKEMSEFLAILYVKKKKLYQAKTMKQLKY